jgi:hypothetical protein
VRNRGRRGTLIQARDKKAHGVKGWVGDREGEVVLADTAGKQRLEWLNACNGCQALLL